MDVIVRGFALFWLLGLPEKPCKERERSCASVACGCLGIVSLEAYFLSGVFEGFYHASSIKGVFEKGGEFPTALELLWHHFLEYAVLDLINQLITELILYCLVCSHRFFVVQTFECVQLAEDLLLQLTSSIFEQFCEILGELVLHDINVCQRKSEDLYQFKSLRCESASVSILLLYTIKVWRSPSVGSALRKEAFLKGLRDVTQLEVAEKLPLLYNSVDLSYVPG